MQYSFPIFHFQTTIGCKIIEKKRNKGTKTEKLKLFLHHETF